MNTDRVGPLKTTVYKMPDDGMNLHFCSYLIKVHFIRLTTCPIYLLINLIASRAPK